MSMIPLTPVEKVIRFLRSVWAQILFFLSRFNVAPLRWLSGRLRALGLWYRDRIWARWTKDKQGRFNNRRAIAVVAATFLALWTVPFIVTTSFNIGLMATTWKKEKVYLTNTQELDADNDVHSVRGCTVFPCTEKDAIYFRVRGTTLHDAYSMFTRGGLFYAEEVASVVAPGVNECEVTSYGIRIRALRRGWGVYPNMLNAVCIPYEDAKSRG